MADIEREVILKVGTQDGVKNVAELQNYIKSLKAALKDQTKTYEENKVAAEELRAAQAALRVANHETTLSVEEQIARSREILSVDGQLIGSYNQLSRAVIEMKNAYHATTDAVERAKLAAEIARGDKALKEMDANVGQYGRNVGNYKSALDGLGGGLKLIGANATSVLGPIQMMTSGFKAASATPLIAVLGVLVGFLMKVSETMKKSEAATHAMRQATAAFEPVLNLTTKAIEKIGIGLSKVVEWAGKWISKLAGVKEASEAAIERTRALNELEKESRELSVEEAALEKKVSELRLQAAQKDKYSAQQRAKFLEEAAQAEEEFAKKALEHARDRARLAKAQLDATVSGTEDQERAAQAAAAAFQEEAKWNQKLLTIIQQKNRVNKEAAREEVNALNEIENELKELATQYEKLADESLAKLFDEQEEANRSTKALEDIRLSYLSDGVERRKELLERDELNAREKEDKIYEIEMNGLNARAGLLKRFRQDALDRGDLQAALKYEEDLQDTEFEIEQAGYMRRKKLRDREVSDRRAALQTMVSFTTTILGAVADVYESAGDMSEAEAQRMKGLRIAAAIIETIAGAVSAYMGTLKAMAGSPYAIPLAAANAATVLAAGYAQVSKIQNTDATGRGASASSGGGMQMVAVNAPAPVEVVPVTRSLTSASEEARLNEPQNIRVNLVYSDVEAARDRVNVVDSETELG